MNRTVKRQAARCGFQFAEDPALDPTNIGEREIMSAHRMFMEPHMGYSQSCKRNCRANPRCLAGLGEKVWLSMVEEEEELELESELLRRDGIPAGLRNLGNTCYVNSFLQIWFHNSKFRQALYEWDPGEDPEEQDNESILDAELYEPRSKVASLQALFAMMQYTKRKFVDPTDFICKLGLNPSVQQDAQEFSKLFVCLLEKSLAHQSKEEIKTMIQKQFRGEYAYVTTCLTCHRKSVTPSHFYELDLALAGNKNLATCLQDFLKVEKMTGDEKYYCEGCQAKQDATRCCKLRELPPVLNLQLNRFQFDMQYNRKKKLNSALYFPDVLNMAEYLEDKSKDSLYHLTGVLMHVGPDANHGHYIAHIQELETGNWFKFSDEYVVPLDKKTRLNIRPPPTPPSSDDSAKRPRLARQSETDGQNSNNAYMLVYMLRSSIEEIRATEMGEAVKRESVRRIAVRKLHARLAETSVTGSDGSVGDTGAETGPTPQPNRKRKNSSDSVEEVDYSHEYCYSNSRVFPVSFQPHLRTKIDKDNQEFDEELEEKKQLRLVSLRNNNRKRLKMVELYKALKWTPPSEIVPMNGDTFAETTSGSVSRGYEFVPLVWLVNWLTDPESPGPLETRSLLCIHGRLDIDRLCDFKICDADTVDQLVKEYGLGEGPRLNQNALCQLCVTNTARTISLDFKILQDQEFFKSQLNVPTDGKGFWVGKKSLNNWRRLAKVALEDRIIKEAQDWQLHKSEPQKNCAALDGRLENGLSPTKKRLSAETEPIKENSPGGSASRSGIDILDLKSKLEKMGTNVSLALGGGSSSSGSPGACRRTGNPLDAALSASAAAGISVIRNGESFNLANIAEVKLNFDESAQRRQQQLTLSPAARLAKPSCAVRPMMKTLPVKPLATVRPLMQHESQPSASCPVGEVAATMNGLGKVAKPREDGQAAVSSTAIVHVNGADNVGSLPQQQLPVPLKPLAAGGLLQSGDVSSPPPTAPPVAHVSAMPKLEHIEDEEKVKPPLSPSEDIKPLPAEPKSPVIRVAGEMGRLNGDHSSSQPASISTAVRPVGSATSESEDIFNADIVCPHGNLRIEERCKQLISREAWFRLCYYFDKPKTFQFGVKPCVTCKEELGAANLQKEKWREEAVRQRSRLPDLFSDIDRPKWSKPTTMRVYLISANFVLAWRGFVRGLSAGKADTAEAITDINNAQLLCEHGGLLFPPTINWEVDPDPAVVMVREDEWRTLEEMFRVDVEIRVDRENTASGPVLLASPAPCEKCVSSKEVAEQESRLRYTNASVYVTFLSQDEELPNGESHDPEYCSRPETPGLVKMADSAVRRSTRRKRVRGEKEFTVNSDTLLRDLKVKIMEVFKVAPFDQILFLNGEYLRDNHLNLGQLGVLPGSAIFLKADEVPVCGPSPAEEWSAQHPEQGFKGTGLLSS